MSSYSQQDELEQLKAWWKDYGVSLMVGVLLGVVILLGYRYWTQYQTAQHEAASVLYDQLLEQIKTTKSEAQATGEKLIGEYSSTPYAGMAALLSARQAFDAGDKTLARQRLEWALANAKDPATKHAARLRLGYLLLDTGDTGAVAALVQVNDMVGFEAEYFELKGDLARAQNQKDAARAAYREAQKFLTAGSPYANVIAMKLDDLGPEQQP